MQTFSCTAHPMVSHSVVCKFMQWLTLWHWMLQMQLLIFTLHFITHTFIMYAHILSLHTLHAYTRVNCNLITRASIMCKYLFSSLSLLIMNCVWILTYNCELLQLGQWRPLCYEKQPHFIPRWVIKKVYF
jgi:hypothetical protein